MEQLTNRTASGARGGRRVAPDEYSGGNGGIIAAVVALAIVVVLAVAYLALCIVSAGSDTFFTNTSIAGIDVGGLSIEEAADKLNEELSAVFDEKTLSAQVTDREEAGSVSASLSELGVSADGAATAQNAMDKQKDSSFFSVGWRRLFGSSENDLPLTWDEMTLQTETNAMAADLSAEPVDMTYEVQGDLVQIVKEQSGWTVDATALARAVRNCVTENGLGDSDLSVTVNSVEKTAVSYTAQEIHDEVGSTMKNAGYDVATGTITPEQTGASFDIEAAQASIDAAKPGETISIQATIEQPAVTAAELSGVLFRDVLGSATTVVSGTAARKTNVRLATQAINGTVLNSGDIFSYNDTVGQRTAAKGYQAAPAYVQGETVNEIGGGICQVSSTLYLACLNSNLNIVERYAHRYKSSYIALGMDATVSWGSPDYRFSDDTNYPIKVVATYEGNNLTVKILGTKTDDITVKMTYTVSSDGYTVVTYRNLYDGSGNLISSNKEATSNYKAHVSSGSSAAVDEATETPETTTETTTPSESETSTEPETSTKPVTPSTPETSTEPTTPTETTTPSTPETPTEPTTPTEPVTPSEPETPAEPTTPTEPATPSESETPVEPTTPTEPATPSTPETGSNDEELPSPLE